jgi:hypothetical protein
VRSRVAACLISLRSDVFSGSRNSGSVLSACALRSQSSAGAQARSASSSATLLMPLTPIVSARALSIFCLNGIAVYCGGALETFQIF